MKKLFLKLIVISFLFICTPKSANAVVCNITTPQDQIYLYLTPIEIECTGLTANKDYMAIAKMGATIQSAHCAKSDSSGIVNLLITPRSAAGDYLATITEYRKVLGGCNSLFASGKQDEKTFTVRPVATPTITTCSGTSGEGMMTSLGCIPTKPDQFVSWILKNAIGLGGGIAFLLILWGAFQVLTSGGSPEKLNNGKDVIVSAISGLLLIIFSVVILKLIGVDIFSIPGFNP